MGRLPVERVMAEQSEYHAAQVFLESGTAWLSRREEDARRSFASPL